MASIEIPTDLPALPKRIVLHWTGGTHHASTYEREHYHYLVEGDGTVVEGVPVRANMRTLQPGDTYAAHTRAMNSYSVGVAACGMHGAIQGAGDGAFPLTEVQVEAMAKLVGLLCRTWGLPVNTDTVFTHPEAELLHDVKQAGKWDLERLPFRPDAHAWENAAWLRSRVKHYAEKV